MQIHTPFDFCQAVGLPVTAVPDLVEVFRRTEEVELQRAAQRRQRLAGAPAGDRLPLIDESGDEFGQVEARIPADIFFNFGLREGFDAWEDPGVMKEFLKCNPACRINTVAPRNRVVLGWRGPSRTVVRRY